MLSRIDPVESRPEDRDAAATGVERGAMRRRVDAARQAAHDDDAGRRQLAADRRGNGQPLARRGARPDHGDHSRRVQRGQRTAQPQHRRRIGNRAQGGRVLRRAQRHHALADGRAGADESRRLLAQPVRLGGGVRRVAGAAAGPDEEGFAVLARRQIVGLGDGTEHPVTDERAEQSSSGIAEQGQREGVEVGHAASGSATRRPRGART